MKIIHYGQNKLFIPFYDSLPLPLSFISTEKINKITTDDTKITNNELSTFQSSILTEIISHMESTDITVIIRTMKTSTYDDSFLIL